MILSDVYYKGFPFKFWAVLILVLMDDTLWPMNVKSLNISEVSLNPCFNGWYSLTRWK